MAICPKCQNQIDDNYNACPYCGTLQKPQPKRSNKLLWVITICLFAIAAALITILILLIVSRQTQKPRTFDFNSAKYTEQVNKLVGDAVLDSAKWQYQDTNAVYTADAFSIDLSIDRDSEKVNKISVGPADSEVAVKLASVSLMIIDTKLMQGDAYTKLPEFRQFDRYVFVPTDDPHKPTTPPITDIPTVPAPSANKIDSPTTVPTSETQVQTTAKPTAAPTTAAPTTVPKTTAPPATKARTPIYGNYTAVDLVNKSLSEIIDIMGGDFEVGDRRIIHYTSPAPYIYNDDVLPGFVFYIKPADGYSYDELSDSESNLAGVREDVLAGKYDSFYFIGVFDGARYDDRISSDMHFNEICEIMGTDELAPLAGAGTPRQYVSYPDRDAVSACIYYYSSLIKVDSLKQENPSIYGIAVFP